ncbi:MAG: hypothetical protein R3E32_02370 [Chitinophagales bacterium]
MKKLFIILLLWLPMSLTFAQIEFPKIFNKGDGIKLPKIKTAQKSFSEVLQKFDKKDLSLRILMMPFMKLNY